MVEFSYIHIPFCSKKCKYCAFISFINLNCIDEYINSLILQIKKEYNNEPQKTLYIGGGTPSLLKIKQIETIIKQFNFVKNPEITMELNPENLNKTYIKGLKNIGITRVSLGAQTFDDKILQKIGRGHSVIDCINAINILKKYFCNISIDLMYGLPYQTIKGLKNDIKIIKNLEIQHISTYGLKIEEKTYFDKFKPDNLPNDDIQADMYNLILEEFKNWYHYEISNFAIAKKFISKHNSNYWNMLPYYGFGLSASGFSGKIRYKNTENIKKYLINPFLKEETMEANLLDETIFLGFRRINGIDTKFINKKFNIDFDKKYKNILDRYIETGHITKTKSGYKLSDKGILISNYILSDFI